MKSAKLKQKCGECEKGGKCVRCAGCGRCEKCGRKIRARRRKGLSDLIGLDMVEGMQACKKMGLAYRVKRCFSTKEESTVVGIVVTDRKGNLKAEKEGVSELERRGLLGKNDVVTLKVARPTLAFMIYGIILVGVLAMAAMVADWSVPGKMLAQADATVLEVLQEMELVAIKPTVVHNYCTDLAEKECFDDSDLEEEDTAEEDLVEDEDLSAADLKQIMTSIWLEDERRQMAAALLLETEAGS